jgi:hypothetical protein
MTEESARANCPFIEEAIANGTMPESMEAAQFFSKEMLMRYDSI